VPRSHTLLEVLSGLCFLTILAVVISGLIENRWISDPVISLGSDLYCIVSEMTYNVSSGTLNPTIPHHTVPYWIDVACRLT